MCQNILQGLQANDPTLIEKGLDEITPARSIRYYTCKSTASVKEQTRVRA